MRKRITDLLKYSIDTFSNTQINITSGTPGSYATYQTIDVSKEGYTPVGIIGMKVSHGGSYHPAAFLNGSNVILNYYRAGTAAYTVPSNDITVTVLYKKAR